MFGAGYIWSGLSNVNDRTSGAKLYDANNVLTIDWAVAVTDTKACWYINGELIYSLNVSGFSFFNIGALSADVVVYDVEVTTKAEDSAAYAEQLKKYGIN